MKPLQTLAILSAICFLQTLDKGGTMLWGWGLMSAALFFVFLDK